MMIYILFVSWVVTANALGDAELHPIKTQDLKSIVDSVKKDVDRHLKMAYAGRRLESISIPDSPELSAVVEDTDNGKEYRNFMKMIQDSMHHHLVRNLGQPSDAEIDGSTVYMKPTPESKSTLFNIESASEQLSNADDHFEEPSQIRVGSMKGVPGVNFPDYTDIPVTSFTCSGKPTFPGFYADLDTGCQVFHVCWPDRRESFLCPMGTIFNQALRVCDYWYNSNCSLAPYYYIMNSELKPDLSKAENVSSMIETLLEKTDSDATEKPDSTTYGHAISDSVMPFISQFIPIKAKIAVYPKTATQLLKIVTTASIGDGKKWDFKQNSHRKNRHTSKHSRVRRSLEYTKSTHETDIENLLLEYPEIEIILFRLFEALDRAVVDIENNETLSMFSGNVKRVVKGIKTFFDFLIGEPLKHFGPDPSFEEDLEMKEKRYEVVKNILLTVSVLMEEFNKLEAQFLRGEPLHSELINNLGFIINPAAEPIYGLENHELPTLRVKRSSTTFNSSKLSHEDSLNIHPETKKLLLKNYMKLFKTKHKHA